MDVLNLCTRFIAVLLGIAYPILTQIEAKDKYSSKDLLEIYRKEPARRLFKISLVISLVLSLLTFLQIPPLFNFGIKLLDSFISNSAEILLLFFTTLLVASFFYYLKAFLKFQRSNELVKHLMSFKKEVLEKNNFVSFKAMNDLLVWSVRKDDKPLAQFIYPYFEDIFQEYGSTWEKEETTSNEGLIYPDSFYWMVYNTIEQLLKNSNNRFHFLEVRTSGSSWLLNNSLSKQIKISEQTYIWIWRNIVLAIENERMDLVFNHWKTAHQYITFNLGHIEPKYDYDSRDLNILNQAEIDNRANERELFFEFHFALGGLLLYMGQIEFIKKLFSYTTSQPPDYRLLPNSMNDIFKLFFKFLDPYDRNFPWIRTKYWFPNIEGMQAEGQVKSWICKYISILYLRQFNVITNYTYQRPIAAPILPNDIKEKREWLNGIGTIKQIIETTINDNSLLEKIGFDQNNDYQTKIDEIEKSITEDFNQAEKEAKVEKGKKELFFETTKNLLSGIFNFIIQHLANSTNENWKDEKDFPIKGGFNLTEKSSFTNNGIEHLNFHSFLPEIMDRRVKENLSSIFYVNRSKDLLFDAEDIFKAVDKLKLDAEVHIILIFGSFNFSYYINNLKIELLSEDFYKGIKILRIAPSVRNVGTSLFILEKKNLPKISFQEISSIERDLYEYELLDKETNLYATVSDLFENKNLKSKISDSKAYVEKDLDKFVFQGISFSINLSFPKRFKLIRIQVKSMFDRSTTIANKLSDIKKF